MNPFCKIFHIFCQKNPFLRKITKIDDILQKFLNFFKKYFKNFKISIFMEQPYKSTEISDESYYLLEKFSKNLNTIGLDSEETIGNGMKILENFGENRL